jgi:hypothetical protein
MTIKYTTIFHPKASKIYPNLGFWFENKPSGNPAFSFSGTTKPLGRKERSRRSLMAASTDQVAF